MKLTTALLLTLGFVSCGEVPSVNDTLNDLTGATRAVDKYDKHKKTIKNLENEIVDLKNDIRNINIDFSNTEELLKQQLADATERIDKLLGENSYLRRIRTSYYNKIQVLRAELSSLEATNEDLKEINKAIIDQNGVLVNKVYYLQRYNSAILSAYVRKWYEVRSLQNLLIEKDKRISDLKDQVYNLQQIVNGYRNNSVVVYLMNLLNSGVTQLHIKFENGSVVKLKNTNGEPILTPVDSVVTNNSPLD